MLLTCFNDKQCRPASSLLAPLKPVQTAEEWNKTCCKTSGNLAQKDFAKPFSRPHRASAVRPECGVLLFYCWLITPVPVGLCVCVSGCVHGKVLVLFRKCVCVCVCSVSRNVGCKDLFLRFTSLLFLHLQLLSNLLQHLLKSIILLLTEWRKKDIQKLLKK